MDSRIDHTTVEGSAFVHQGSEELAVGLFRWRMVAQITALLLLNYSKLLLQD
jgi:hypothetical protein